ncbi:MAG: D-alanine--D-alanine ligase [Bacteroidales bacterium]|nr:D-alanine--D-alanine ligase [Bacteroidales bacterium]
MKKVAVVAGGYSSEYPISVQSGRLLVEEVSKAGYEVYLVEISPQGWFVHLTSDKRITIDRSDFSFNNHGKSIRFDAIVMAIHGTPGEDGKLQGYFDLLNIPYTCCGVLASAVTFNKHACKLFARQIGIDTADSLILRKGDFFSTQKIIEQVGLPCFVKPTESGSSFGVSKVTHAHQLSDAIVKAFEESNEVLIEKFISGTEVTCGMVSFPEGDLIFPITEVISKKEFFDFEAKYTSGLSEEITPARIDEYMTLLVQNATQKLYHALGCKGITRTDFIISDGKAYLLEVNTVPGMSPHSIIPKQLQTMGITVAEMYDRLLKNICTKR